MFEAVNVSYFSDLDELDEDFLKVSFNKKSIDFNQSKSGSSFTGMQNYECYNFIINLLTILLTKMFLNVLKWTPTHSTWHFPIHFLSTSFLHPSNMNFIPIFINGSLLNLVPVNTQRMN